MLDLKDFFIFILLWLMLVMLSWSILCILFTVMFYLYIKKIYKSKKFNLKHNDPPKVVIWFVNLHYNNQPWFLYQIYHFNYYSHAWWRLNSNRVNYRSKPCTAKPNNLQSLSHLWVHCIWIMESNIVDFKLL